MPEMSHTVYVPFVNSCLFLATLTLWFWHVGRGLIDGATSARVVLYQKSLRWLGLAGLVLLLQRRFLVLSHWAKISLAGASPDGGDSPPSSHPFYLTLGLCFGGGGLWLSPHRISICRSVRRAWGLGKCADLGDLPPNRFCLPSPGLGRALGQVVGVCLRSQPELKGCVDLALGELCASQIFSFPSDNLLVVSTLATTKCFFIPKPSWGFHRSFLQLLGFRCGRCEGADEVVSWQRHGCSHHPS